MKTIMKYINGIRYGSRDTKVYLCSVAAGILLTVVLLILSCIHFSWGRIFGTILAGVITMIIWQSKTLTDAELNPEHTSKQNRPKQDGQSKEKRLKLFKERMKEKVKGNKEKTKKSTDAPSDCTDKGMIRKGAEEIEEGKTEGKIEERRESRFHDLPETQIPETYAQYTEVVIKRELRHYRVKKGHQPIMIDSWLSQGVEECPAYLWKDRRYAHFLLLTETPRRVKIPLSRLTKMYYAPGERVRETDYKALQEKNFVSVVFEPYLPGTYQERQNKTISRRKNLYRLDEDLYVTNTSVRNIRQILHPAFQIEDAITRDDRYSGFFLDAYHYYILLRDSVVSMKEYTIWIKSHLQSMAQAKIPFDVFRKTLEQMVEYRFITDEFADYYVNYRMQWHYKNEKGKE